MELLRRITVAIADPTEGELFRYARVLAEIAPASTELRFVHVLGRPAAPGAYASAWRDPSTRGVAPPEATARVAERQAAAPTHRAALEALRRAAAMHLPSTIPWHCHVRRGDRIDQVLHDVAEWGSDLLLIGHRRASRGRRSMARRLAMKAPCSLWMVPEGTARPVRRLLVAVDFSPASALAVSVAGLVARRARAAHCVVLHVRAPGTPSVEASVDGDVDAGVDAISRASDDQAFRRFLAPLDLRDVPVDVRTVESGSTAGTIGRVALEAGADLIVAGTRGRSPSATILLGSESEQLLAEATSPLLVIRPRGDRPGLLEALLDQEFKPAPASAPPPRAEYE